MPSEQGLGTCLIPDDTGKPCGQQIQEGEPIATVMLPGGPHVGHKRCGNGFYARKQQAERERMDNLVKDVKQGGPGGPVDMTTAVDTVIGSIPLVSSEEKSYPEGDKGSTMSEAVTVTTGNRFLPPAPVVPELTKEDLQKLEDYKQSLLQNRAAAPPLSVVVRNEVLPLFYDAVARLNDTVLKMAAEYDKVVGERDLARAENTTKITRDSPS